jgi:hypothetical protein
MALSLRCTTISTILQAGRHPGNDHWHLAPASLTWEGRSLGQICGSKDPARNGDKHPDVVHMR